MRFDFAGRKTVVTGASQGLGAALVAELRGRGADVTPVSRGDDWDPADFDCLFLNASFGLLQSSASPLGADVREMFDVNVLRTIEQAHKALAAGASHVHVVGSNQSIVAAPASALYSATKHAVRGWAYGSARELPGRVSISYPGGIATNFFKNLRGDEEMLADYLSRVEDAKANYDTPDDVARGIVDGVHFCAREIIPTPFALEWFERNGEDVSRMWHPGLEQPSRAKWDWWTLVRAHALTSSPRVQRKSSGTQPHEAASPV
ncbi:MAG: SDR family NAD(P)-dependent oxidoreductase [Myxococcota bacterium]